MAERSLAVAIDTASDLAGVALLDGGELLASLTAATPRNHSRELLPALDSLLQRHSHTKEEIGAVFVCLGPGSYAGLRVGVSTAKALAYGLGASLVGVGRLVADAEPFVATATGRVLALHAAGRADLAWAIYAKAEDGVREVAAPRLGSAAALLAAVQRGDLVVGEARALSDDLRGGLANGGALVVEAAPERVLAVARLGHQRLNRGETDDPDTLVPLYLRAPAIGPQRQ